MEIPRILEKAVWKVLVYRRKGKYPTPTPRPIWSFGSSKELVHAYRMHQNLFTNRSQIMEKAWISIFLLNSSDHIYAKASLKNVALEATLEQWFSNFNDQILWYAFSKAKFRAPFHKIWISSYRVESRNMNEHFPYSGEHALEVVWLQPRKIRSLEVEKPCKVVKP